MVIKPQYKRASTFSQNGLALVLKEEGFGFINAKGEVAIEFQKNKMEPFAPNALALIQKDGKYGFMDSHGKIVIPAIYDYAQSFMSNGYTIVQKNAKYGVIDSNGAFKIKPEFTNIRNPSGDDSLALKHESRGWEVYDMSSGKIIATFKADEKDVAYEISNAKGEIIWPKNAQTVAVTSQSANIVKKVPELVVEKPKIPNASNIVWEAKVDFAGGYYDLFYENGLVYALPSLYRKDILSNQEINEANINECRLTIDRLYDVYSKSSYDLKNNIASTKLYSGENVEIGKFADIVINGIAQWRLPTVQELKQENKFIQWQKMMCKRYQYKDFRTIYEQGGIFPVAAFDNGRIEDIAYRYNIDKHEPKKTKLEFQNFSSDSYSIVLAKDLKAAQKDIMNNSKFSIIEKIRQLAQLEVEEKTTVAKIDWPKPILNSIPPMQQVTKDEFETTASYEQRLSKAKIEHDRLSAKINDKNNAALREYEVEKENMEKQYAAEVKRMTDKEYRANLYQSALKNAFALVVGRPYVKNISYDADSQKMKAVIFSAQVDNFEYPVSFDVPLSSAKTFKEDLLNRNVVPVVILNSNAEIVDFKTTVNQSRIDFEFVLAKGKNSIDGYNAFLAQYPDSGYVKEAKNAIAKIEQANKQEKIKQDLEAKKQAAKDAESQKRRTEEQERINKLYNLPKNIGDKVCRKMETCGLFGCDSYEVSAFVEGKSGDRIQIRIADPKVMRSYQGVDIYKGSILWDQYNNWKPCN